jgi:hypothetical protein
MNIKDLVARIKTSESEALAKVPNGRAMTVLREALRLIKEEVEKTEEGLVNVPLLGQFRVRQVDVVKDGQTVKARRVLFVEARVREAAEEGVATTVQAA